MNAIAEAERRRDEYLRRHSDIFTELATLDREVRKATIAMYEQFVHSDRDTHTRLLWRRELAQLQAAEAAAVLQAAQAAAALAAYEREQPPLTAEAVAA